MRELNIWSKMSSKVHYEGATLFQTPIGDFRLTLGAAYTLCTLVRNGKLMPIERYRDADVCTLLFQSAAPYALTHDQVDYVMSCAELERDAWLLGYAKSSQQKIR